MAFGKITASALALLISGTMTIIANVPAYAAKTPTSLVTDARMKHTLYDPDQVYEVVGSYGYHTMLQFAKDEQIKVVSLGDTLSWETVPYKNLLFMKPVEPNASTNLTVVTTKRIYHFNLRSTTDTSQMTFNVQFVYPNDEDMIVADNPAAAGADGSLGSGAQGLQSGLQDNLNYSSSGDKEAIKLIHAFDDGRFTYFQFVPGTEPAEAYVVYPDGSEARTNLRRYGKYYVMDRVAQLITLRNNNAVLCVSNDANPLKLPQGPAMNDPFAGESK